MPFGGGGALHAGALIREIGLKCAVVPRFPGITSALGCVIADLRHDQVQTLNLMLDGLDIAALDARMVDGGRGGEARGRCAPAFAVERIDVIYELDMHYLGQTHTVAVPLPVTLAERGIGVSEAVIRNAFEAAYVAAFGRLLPGIPVRIVSLRTAAIGRRPAFDLSAFAPPADGSLAKARAWRTAGLVRRRLARCAVWSRLDLPAGAVIEWPAILEQPDATTLIEPGLRGRVDALGNVDRRAAAHERVKQSAATALLLLDLQNDFLHPQTAPTAGPARPARQSPRCRRGSSRSRTRCARSGGLVVATLFTLVPGRGGEPIISPHLKNAAAVSRQRRFRAGLVGPAACR